MQTMSLRTKMKMINGDSLTPILIFRRLQGERKFLLESSAQHEGAGRYSFIGANPRKTYKGQGDEIQEVAYKTGQVYTHKGDLFVLLKRLMPRISNTTQFPFSGGAVGYVRHKEASVFIDQDEKLSLPDVYFHVYETIIVFDHVTDEVTLIHTNIDAEKKEPNLDELAKQLLTAKEGEEPTCFNHSFESGSIEQFQALLIEAKEKLVSDDERIVLSKQFLATLDGDAFALYRILRKKNPSAYMYYVAFDDHIVMGTSPESLIRVKGERVLANPTEGMIKRGETKADDLANERKLVEDSQIRNAHTALVRVKQQELQSVCVRDSIQLLDSMRIERSKQAMYMTTRLEGKLLPMLHALDVLKATLPARSQNGEETADKFGGAVGFIGFNGHLDFALTAKSMVVVNQTLYMQTAITVTKNTNVSQLIEQLGEEEQFFRQFLTNEGSTN